MIKYCAKFLGVFFMLFSVAVQALVVIENSWMEVVSDAYIYNDDETDFVGQGNWTYTGAASNQYNLTDVTYPQKYASALTSEDFASGYCLDYILVAPDLSGCMFSGRLLTDDNWGVASSTLTTSWRFTTSFDIKFEIGMLAEAITSIKKRLYFTIYDNTNGVLLYSEAGSGSFPAILNAKGLLKGNGDYTLTMRIDRSVEPFAVDDVWDGVSDFYFAIGDTYEYSPAITHVKPRVILPKF
jgi:hypothetical protein